MTVSFAAVESIVSSAIGLNGGQSGDSAGSAAVFPACRIEVRWRGEVVLSLAAGRIDPERGPTPVTADTRFDLASVTKLFTVAAFMTLVEEGRVDVDSKVSSVLPEFSGMRPPAATTAADTAATIATNGAATTADMSSDGPATSGPWSAVDAGAVRFRDILRHSSGLPAGMPFYRAGSVAAARKAVAAAPFAYPTGTRVVYSDVGLILLGFAIERLSGTPLDEAIRRRVTAPLGLAHTDFIRRPYPAIGPTAARDEQEDIAATEYCRWRRRRIVGEVHDENAAGLGGVAGHAGLFSTASDTAAFGQSFLDHGLLKWETVAEMRGLQAEDGTVRRGLGFALWSPNPEAAANPLGPRTFGHNGFTGTSLWMDPDRELVVACLTNRVYSGRDAAGITAFRVALHGIIRDIVDAGSAGGSAIDSPNSSRMPRARR